MVVLAKAASSGVVVIPAPNTVAGWSLCTLRATSMATLAGSDPKPTTAHATESTTRSTVACSAESANGKSPNSEAKATNTSVILSIDGSPKIAYVLYAATLLLVSPLRQATARTAATGCMEAPRQVRAGDLSGSPPSTPLRDQRAQLRDWGHGGPPGGRSA